MSLPMNRRVVALGVVFGLLIGIVMGGLWLWRNRFFEELGWTGSFLVVCFALGLVSEFLGVRLDLND